MLSLPNAELYVWIRWNEEGEKLAEEIEKLLGFEPYEATVSQGICDLRWEAKDFQTAVGFAEQLKKYVEREEIVLLKATGKVAGEREALTLKDNRRQK